MAGPPRSSTLDQDRSTCDASKIEGVTRRRAGVALSGDPARAIFITAFARVLVGAHTYEEAERELDTAYAILISNPAFCANHLRAGDSIR